MTETASSARLVTYRLPLAESKATPIGREPTGMIGYSHNSIGTYSKAAIQGCPIS
jgi:hypothetical protein